MLATSRPATPAQPVGQGRDKILLGPGLHPRRHLLSGFQFLPGSGLHPAVFKLFNRAMALNIPQKNFTAWMLTPLAGPRVRPVDALHRSGQLVAELDAFARRAAPPAARR